ncbi:hormogonium polysaccharide biosynthesis protein HpsA [Nostoc sp.]|uniref:hormogonium polysaccharide biosynthesis protein HpsA n=1 Tax=Nostoc sp. TaxID=1180 RepID=UPI002FF6F5DE
MSRKRQLFKVIKKPFRQISKQFLSAINKQTIWLLRTIFGTQRRRGSVNSGFVLPTVAMVVLVVVLLTTAILFRSFERSKNASNVRVNEATMQAATPALDRAKAKITALFADPTLPRSVPSNVTLYNTLINKLSIYTFGDETPISLAYNLNKSTSSPMIEAGSSVVLENKENIQTAWKFPADTDNNGKFDSFILYGLYFRTPPQTGTTQTRSRSPLDARTPPMLPAKAGGACDIAGDTSASLVGSSGWYKLPTGELKKSFFVYAVTVPISDTAQATSLDTTKYEKYRGNKGFSALEMQQDRNQVPITNNAVVYEDDLDITPGPRFRLNGRIFTNSNLFTGETNEDITFFQVSSRYSCYYERENSKIVVGGNIATNNPISTTNLGGTRVDLFRENNAPDTSKSLAGTNKTTSNNSSDIAYNTQAYAQRIDLLVNAQLANTDPQEIQTNINNRLLSDPSLDATKVRKEELGNWFRKRTRRVPFKEVPYGTSGIEKSAGVDYTTADAATFMKGSVNTLRPMDAWIYPTDTNTTLTLNTAQLPTRDPDVVDNTPVIETELGDRIVVGNNLPELIWDSTKGDFVGEDNPQAITPAVKWTSSTTKDRTRSTRVRQLSDLGVTGRDGFWEISAASPRTSILDVVGGLRVITGAGIYKPTGSGLPTRPTTVPNDPSTSGVNENAGTVVWPDSMPMLVPDPTDPLNASKQKRGDLVMRATVVYHYNFDSYNPQAATPDDYQTPMACVSSYYDPTNKDTARNTGTLADVSGEVVGTKPAGARSNNGIVYEAPATTSAGITRGQAVDSNGFFAAATNDDDVTNTSVTLLNRLKHQANLVFPNGRLVNPLLRQALAKATTSKLTLSEQSAIDSTICAIQIADGTLTTSTTYVPDGAIKETAFLDARQIKAIDKGAALTGKYNLEVEQRQPLEIRAITIDLSLLRTQAIGSVSDKEYLLPNSGIIYASRDDAQKDRSDSTSDNVSASDYKLDPERRPNAIMLINGSNLSRQVGSDPSHYYDYRPEEKGLILATELPAYVKGNFNLHAKQEFLGGDLLDPSASDYDTKFYTRTAANRDRNFACRPNDSRLPNCTTGETWRPASVIADAVTLLSGNFREGFRNEGDYDLRNNYQVSNADAVLNRLKAGFWNNNFVTSSNFFTASNDDTYYKGGSADTTNDFNNTTRLVPNPNNSSYLNNFVTPIQRRGSFPEYVMEMCFKIPVSECRETEWYIGYDGDRSIQSHNLPANAQRDKLLAGTTAQSANVDFRRFARRVAFKRDINGKLLTSGGAVITSTNLSQNNITPVALGITTVGGAKVVAQFNDGGSLPEPANNALWFATTKEITPIPKAPGFSGSDIIYKNNIRLFYRYPQVPDASLPSSLRDFPGSTTTFTRDGSFQPLLEPVLQLQVTTTDPDNTEKTYAAIASSSSFVKNTRWLSLASDTTFNLVIASGDSPARVGSSTYEINGGLHNFVRFLENWNGINANINGSFIQFKRSIYASAPFQVLVRPGPTTVAATSSTPSALSSTANIDSIFFRILYSIRPGYTSDSTFTTNGAGEAPYYMPPNRNWGFDVALLAQNPDLFAQRFVTPAADPPSEYFREVGRDDLWVKTLLCAVQTQTADGFDTADTTYFGNGFKFALPATERPTSCQLQPS